MSLINTPLPPASLLKFESNDVVQVNLNALIAGKRAVIFALPGAWTRTCTAEHIPSFIRVAEALRAKGLGPIICIAVNDPFVMAQWGEATGASAAGIEMLSDAEASFTHAMGMGFDAPAVGLINRSKRYAMVVVDGTITAMNVEESPGSCALSAGDAVLESLSND